MSTSVMGPCVKLPRFILPLVPCFCPDDLFKLLAPTFHPLQTFDNVLVIVRRGGLPPDLSLNQRRVPTLDPVFDLGTAMMRKRCQSA